MAASAPAAPWLEPPRRSLATAASLRPFRVIEAIHRIALVDTNYGHVVVDEVDGISGVYELGEVADATFTADRTLYVLHPDSTLDRWSYRAGVGLAERARVGGLTDASFIVSGSTLLATSTDDAVLVSSNRGESFASTKFVGEEIERVRMRDDDAIVVQTTGPRGLVTRLSMDGGKTFQETVRVPPIEGLGGVLFGYDESCAFTPSWAVLSKNGTFLDLRDRPLAPPYDERQASLFRWFAMSSVASARVDAPMPWASDLVAPADTTPKYAGYPQCDPPTGHTHPHRTTKTVKPIETKIDQQTFECSGIACVAGVRTPPLPPTRTHAHLFDDGPRHVLFLDDDTEAIKIVAVPTECSPRFVTYASGLVVLACKDELYASSADGRWAERFSIAASIALNDFEMAADGTAMFAHYGEGARAFVRAPVALGAKAWRDASHPGAVSYALRSGGVVDVIIGDGDLLTLIDSPMGKRDVLTRVRIGDLWCVGRKNGRIVGIRRKPAGSFERIVIDQSGVTVDGPVLDGSGATDPTGACGH